MLVTAPTAHQLDEAFALIVTGQSKPATACSYLGTTPEGIRAELDDLDVPWQETVRVALDGTYLEHRDIIAAIEARDRIAYAYHMSRHLKAGLRFATREPPTTLAVE